jgi:hypothetical protein
MSDVAVNGIFYVAVKHVTPLSSVRLLRFILCVGVGRFELLDLISETKNSSHMFSEYFVY